MRKNNGSKPIILSYAMFAAASCFAQSTDPVGPSGWTTRNWIGFALQITLFVLALIGIYKLAAPRD